MFTPEEAAALQTLAAREIKKNELEAKIAERNAKELDIEIQRNQAKAVTLAPIDSEITTLQDELNSI